MGGDEHAKWFGCPLGRGEDAALRKATAILQKLADEFSGESRYRAALAQTYRDSGDDYGAVGELGKAQDYFEEAIELGDSSYHTRYKHALLCFGVRDLAGYREACAAMLQQFSKSSNTSELHFTAWACVLAPDVLDDYSPAIELAERAIKVDPKRPLHQQCFGVVLYRAGRFDKAIETLESVAELEKVKGTSPAYGWFVLAMGHHKLGHDAEAEKWHGKATEWTDKVLAEHEQGTSTLAWNRRLTLKLLHDEAESLLDIEEPSTPEEKEEPHAEAPSRQE